MDKHSEWLRDFGRVYPQHQEQHKAAADALDQLERERDELLLWKEGAINFYPDLADMKVGSDDTNSTITK